MRGFGFAAIVAGVGALGYRLVVTGDLTVDTGLGRTVRPLGPLTVIIAAPRQVVFDVIAGPYLGRTPRAMNDGATRLGYTGELGTDFWAAGRWWGEQVGRKWEATVRASLDKVRREAEQRALAA